VARLADRVLVLERGRLVAEIAPSEVEEPSAHALEDLA
jgi:ABC-type glutathione transport system ATPase component